jgi:malonyl-CoA O-methyltransferase
LLDLPGCVPADRQEEPGLDELIQAVLDAAPLNAVYVGWSLGGQIALELVSRRPDRARGLVTLCSNPRFVTGEDWPGMDAGVFDAFRASYRDNPAAALRRFDSLQVGGSGHAKPLLRQLRGTRPGGVLAGLGAGLKWLGSLDQRLQVPALAQPQLHLFAGIDELVPVGCSTRLSELMSELGQAEVKCLDGYCHVLPLEAPAEVSACIQSFLERQGLLADQCAAPPLLAKEDVAESFSRAAQDYDSVATLQRDVGTRLLTSLEQVERPPTRILDLGCGTGHFLPELARRFPEAEYMGLDLADGMVDYARKRFPQARQWIVADAESLPLAAGSVDLVFSSLAIQWCYRPELLFAELARVLSPGGRCVFTSLGPATLKELRGAWAAVDEHQHVNTFLPASELEDAAVRTPGLSLGLRSEQFSMRYPRVRDLLSELKTLGAHNVNQQRPSGLTGRRALQGMLDAYEHWREDGLLPATYDVLFGVVEKS